eukprot:Gb_38280 [translate_table: standard]
MVSISKMAFAFPDNPTTKITTATKPNIVALLPLELLATASKFEDESVALTTNLEAPTLQQGAEEGFRDCLNGLDKAEAIVSVATRELCVVSNTPLTPAITMLSVMNTL